MAARTIQVEYDDATVSVTYDLEALGQAYAETAQGFALEPRRKGLLPALVSREWGAQSQATLRALATVILSWDITADDGTPYPPTIENLSDLPLRFLSTVQQAIDADTFESGAD